MCKAYSSVSHQQSENQEHRTMDYLWLSEMFTVGHIWTSNDVMAPEEAAPNQQSSLTFNEMGRGFTNVGADEKENN